MRYAWQTISVVVTLALSVALFAPSASACSLAQVPDWLGYVLNHGLANLNADCTLTWKTGVVTDLNGNILYPPPAYGPVLQYGVGFFLAGLALMIVGGALILKSRRLRFSGES